MYDEVNRLRTAEEIRAGAQPPQQWKQQFTYSRFGNRNFDTANTTANVLGPNPTIDATSNRFQGGQGYGYDSSGNLTGDPSTGPNAIVYDAENRQTGYTTTQYFYDGEGRRVKKSEANPNKTTVFVYNVAGQLLAEYTVGSVPPPSGTSYLTTDHLGSTRVVTTAGPSPTVKARYDYLPFGELLASTISGRGTVTEYITNDSTRQKFTGYERDTESGLDFAQSRYCSSAVGRFTSPDSVLGSPTNPQTLNLYAYVINNPLRLVDPTGQMGDGPPLTGLAFPSVASWENYKTDATLTFASLGIGPLLVEEVTVQAPPPQISVAPSWIPSALTHSMDFIGTGGMEAALTSNPEVKGPESVIWGAMKVYGFVGGLLVGSGAGSLTELAIEQVTQQVVTEGAAETVKLTAGVVFRGGSATPDNLTPRPGIDSKGLSTFDSLELATPPGGKAQMIDVSKLGSLSAIPDAPPPGHVSLTPGSQAAITEWAATRGKGEIHPLTREVMQAIVSVVRRAK